MSGGRVQDVDVHQLAAQGAVLEERFQLSKFARLRPLLAVIEDSESRTARARFRFRRQEGRSLASIEVEASLPLTCQRCLQPVNWPITGSAQLAFAEPGSVAPAARAGLSASAGSRARGWFSLRRDLPAGWVGGVCGV